MTTIYYEGDADLDALEGERVAVVGYGNQGRSWALNLRDSGCAPIVCVRRDETREQADRRRLRGARRRGRERRRRHLHPRARRRDRAAAARAEGRLLRDRRERVHARRSAGSTRPATAAWSRRACSAPRCAAATRKASGSSPRSACTATQPARARPACSRSRKAIGGLRQGAHRAHADAGSGARPRRRAGAVARARRR